MTRVVFATDLSETAQVAEDLLGSIRWPADTEFRVVTVVPWLPELVGAPWIAVAPINTDQVEKEQLATAETGVRDVVGRLAAGGRHGTWVVMRGQPADAIVDVAMREEADLIVVGSRHHGSLESALVGSVSEAIVDRAPCPVLIARSGAIRCSLIADDASEGAEGALTFVRERPYLLGTETHLAIVLGDDTPWAEPFEMPVDAHSIQVLVDDQQQLRAKRLREVAQSAADLVAGGQPTVTEFLGGRPGPEIVNAAAACEADLVVVGSRHRTGLTRMILGSVGRHVLHHTACSVLVVGRVPAASGSATGPESRVAAASTVS